MDKVKILTIFGTRPEAIKMAPLVLAMGARERFQCRLAVTAQHREMADQVLELFELKADYDLNIMQAGQSLADIMIRALAGLDEVMGDYSPQLVLVHGDTSTTLAGALIGYYHRADIGHIEAGLRTYDKYQPFPEEKNRHLTGTLADFHFAPTPNAAENLRRENIPPHRIIVTGNTVIDALLAVLEKPCSFRATPLADFDFSQGPSILLTAHRRENWGEPMAQICRAVLSLTREIENLRVIYPIHRNPHLRQTVLPLLDGHPRIRIIEPLDYLHFSHLMHQVTLVLTDSGGIQEEAPALGKPVLVLRDKTERPEALKAGTVRLVGRDYARIKAEAKRLLCDPAAYRQMAKATNPFGDGKAAGRICDFLEQHYFFTEKNGGRGIINN